MKRLMYFSRYALPLTGNEIVALGQRAAERNRALGVTGVLLSLQGTFFQVLEGDEETIDRLFVVIQPVVRDDSRAGGTAADDGDAMLSAGTLRGIVRAAEKSLDVSRWRGHQDAAGWTAARLPRPVRCAARQRL
jgi:hypothetical protein